MMEDVKRYNIIAKADGGYLGKSPEGALVCYEDYEQEHTAREKAEGALEIREPLAWFATQMEEVLRTNDHKGGWQNCSPWWLVDRCRGELGELNVAIRRLLTPKSRKRIIKEAADVANFAMMIADIARSMSEEDWWALAQEEKEGKRDE